jgi:hypothetical protein
MGGNKYTAETTTNNFEYIYEPTQQIVKSVLTMIYGEAEAKRLLQETPKPEISANTISEK